MCVFITIHSTQAFCLKKKKKKTQNVQEHLVMLSIFKCVLLVSSWKKIEWFVT